MAASQVKIPITNVMLIAILIIADSFYFDQDIFHPICWGLVKEVSGLDHLPGILPADTLNQLDVPIWCSMNLTCWKGINTTQTNFSNEWGLFFSLLYINPLLKFCEWILDLLADGFNAFSCEPNFASSVA